MRHAIILSAAVFFLLVTGLPALAQDPPPQAPPPPWTGSVGAGLSLTSGNRDTFNVNLSFDATYDPKTLTLFKAEGLYLRGTTEGEDTANRLFLQGRVERVINERAFYFGQLQHVQDVFKGIDYLVAPTAGLGYKVVDTPVTRFTADTSLGVVWEKNPLVDVRTSAAWIAGEKLSHKLSETTTFTHSAQALWKLDEFGDALYTIGVGLAAQMTPRSQLKAEILDTYKSRPPEGNQGNDVALLVSVVFKY